MALMVKNSPANSGDTRDMGWIPGWGKIPWCSKWQLTPVFLPGESKDGGAWWAVVHGVEKSRTGLSDFTFTFHFYALEKEMATHSSVQPTPVIQDPRDGGAWWAAIYGVGHN